jgi:hypothetical protein
MGIEIEIGEAPGGGASFSLLLPLGKERPNPIMERLAGGMALAPGNGLQGA